MKAATPYLHLHGRKRTWTPVAVSAGTLLEGGEDVIKRALALRCLEIPVGDFISEAMKGDLPQVEGCKELLLSNVVDEENHDIALNFAADAHKVPTRFEAEAEKIKKAWLELDAIRSLRPWCLSVLSSLSYYRYSDSLETQDYARQVPISHGTNRPTSRRTHSSVKS